VERKREGRRGKEGTCCIYVLDSVAGLMNEYKTCTHMLKLSFVLLRWLRVRWVYGEHITQLEKKMQKNGNVVHLATMILAATLASGPSLL
jgi:hypothetical protein